MVRREVDLWRVMMLCPVIGRAIPTGLTADGDLEPIAALDQRLDLGLGTFFPFFRASESPMAMACFLLLTAPPLPPLPRFSLPFFLRCIARFTS
jgi:hypothetical protein